MNIAFLIIWVTFLAWPVGLLYQNNRVHAVWMELLKWWDAIMGNHELFQRGDEWRIRHDAELEKCRSFNPLNWRNPWKILDADDFRKYKSDAIEHQLKAEGGRP